MSIFAFLKAQSDCPVKVAPDEVHSLYRYWRLRILTTSIVGYALYYFVRANISVPLKSMGKELDYSKEQLGLVLTIGGVTYGISKFANGFLGDHANPRYFMALGLAICAVMNVLFGFSSSLVLLCVFWFLNQWAQGMGFPPCAKSMAYWFSPSERNTTFGIWHISHMIGGALIQVLTGFLVVYLGWRACFYIPAGIATLGVVVILLFMRDTPGSLGLPPVEVHKGEVPPPPEENLEYDQSKVLNYERPAVGGDLPEDTRSYWHVVVEQIFKNPYMWIISIANFLVYMLRNVQMHWGPTFLQEAKGMTVVLSGWLGFGSEMGGMVGALIAGFLADRFFGGRAGRVCVIAMLAMTGVIWLFWITPAGSPVLASALFIVMGFLLYIPQMLIAAMAMSLGTKRASAAAVGLTGIFAYASSTLSGWGIGKIADGEHGWHGAFQILLICSVLTAALMTLTWNVGAHAEAAPTPKRESEEETLVPSR